MGHRNFLRGFLLILTVMLFSPLISGADPLDNWHQRYPMTPQASLDAVAYGNNMYVAVGENSAILTSADGVSWNRQVAGTDNCGFYGITYGNGKFVVVGYTDNGAGKIFTSTDSATWTEVPGAYKRLRAVNYANNMFIAVGDSGTILTSSDGSTWTAQTSGTTYTLRAVTYGNGKFVAIGDINSYTSPDGITWTQGGSLSGSVLAVTFGNGIFVAPGLGSYYPNNDGRIFTSTDGSSWTSVTLESGGWRSVIYAGGKFLVVGSGKVMTSTDGSAWTSVSVSGGGWLWGITYGNKFIAVANNGKIFSSSDGATWTDLTGSVDNLNAVVAGGGTLIAAGNSGTILTSSDGTTWTSRTSGTTANFTDIAYYNNKFVVSGDDGTIYNSPDGVTWTQTSSAFTSPHTTAFGNNKYVSFKVFSASDADGNFLFRYTAIRTSSDGTKWTDEGYLPYTLYSITFGNGKFIAAGGGAILASTDGSIWADVTPSDTFGIGFEAVVYGNNTFMAVGCASIGGGIYTSPDGLNWTRRIMPDIVPFPLYGAAFFNNTFVAVGASGTILQSDPVPATSASAAQPDISANTSTINLGSVVVGSTSSQVLAISNKGNASLTVSAVAISGANSSEMSQTNNCTTVPAGSSCTVVVSFSPASIGTKSATLGISSNDPDTATLSIALSGTGVGVPNITLTASAVDFGSVNVGSKASQAITVSNSGSADLKISMLKVAGLHANEITQTNNCSTVTAGSSCTITLAFAPKFPGSKSVTMTVASNDLFSPVIDIQVTGTANSNGSSSANPDISVKTSHLTFDGASTKSLTVSNKGKAELYISSVSVDGTNSDRFIENDNCLTVAPGGSCTISVEFAPDSLGTKSATLTIVSNDPGSQTTTVSLSGSGGAPRIVVKPATLNFSARVQNSSSKSVVISNTGKANLEISSITVTGADAGEFSRSGSCSTIAPKKTCKVTVTFAPTSTGKKNAALSISSNDPDKPEAAAALSGVASQAKKQKTRH